MCDNMKFLAESDENKFIAYCPEHDEFQLAWNRITLHLTATEFEDLQQMFEEILLDEMLFLLQSDETEPEVDPYDESDESDEDDDEIVLWFDEVALRLTVDEFQEMAFLVSEAALAMPMRPASSTLLSVNWLPSRPDFPPTGDTLFSLN